MKSAGVLKFSAALKSAGAMKFVRNVWRRNAAPLYTSAENAFSGNSPPNPQPSHSPRPTPDASLFWALTILAVNPFT